MFLLVSGKSSKPLQSRNVAGPPEKDTGNKQTNV